MSEFEKRVSRPPVVDPAKKAAVRGSKPAKQLEVERKIKDPGSTLRGG